MCKQQQAREKELERRAVAAAMLRSPPAVAIVLVAFGKREIEMEKQHSAFSFPPHSMPGWPRIASP